MTHDESSYGDEIPAWLVRIEDGAPYIDLHQLFVGINALKLGQKGRALLVDLGKPHRRLAERLHDLLLRGGLGKPLPVQINRACMMLALLCIEPVAFDQVAVGIEGTEEGIRNGHAPGVIRDLRPPLDRFGAGDDDFLARCGLIDNAFGIGVTAAWRVDPFAINASMHGDDIAGLREICGMLNGTEGCIMRAGIRILARERHMKLRGVQGGC